ncbi:MAG: hypothetical protein AB1714_23150 [Acidobacteriota bacterium]
MPFRGAVATAFVRRTLLAGMLLLPCSCASPDRAWREAEAKCTREAYEEFIVRFPDHSLVAQARERLAALDWEVAKQKNTRDAYKAFAARYPRDGRVAEARARMESLGWEAARAQGSVDAFQLFLRDFPEPSNAFRPGTAFDMGQGVALTRLDVGAWSADKKRPANESEFQHWKSGAGFTMTISRFIPTPEKGRRCVDLILWFEQTEDKGGDYWFEMEEERGFAPTLVFANAPPSDLGAFIIPGLPFAGDTMVTSSKGKLGLGLKKGTKSWAQLVFEVPDDERAAVLLFGRTPVVFSLPGTT